MRKIMAFIAAFVMAAGCASCGKQEDSPAPEQAQEAVQLSFREAKIAMAEELSRVISLDRAGNNVLIFGEKSDGSFAALVSDTTLRDRRTVEFFPKNGEIVHSACIDSFGRVTILTVLDGETRLYSYNANGISVREENLGEVVLGDAFTGAVHTDGDGYVINVGNEVIAVIDKELKYAGDLNTKGMAILGCCTGNDGKAVVLLGDGESSSIAQVDGTELAEITDCGALSSSAYGMCAGSGDYTLAANFADGLYRLKDGRWARITDYMDNTFNGSSVSGLLALGENEFAVQNTTSSLNCLILLSERDISEIKVREAVSVAATDNNGWLSDLVKKFNSENDSYRIEIVTYSDSSNNKTLNDLRDDIKMDIISGNSPDMVIEPIVGLDPSVYCYDFREFLRNDPDLGEDDFIPGFLDSISFKGTVPTLFTTFSVGTLVGKTKFVGENESVDVDEFIRICDSIPEVTELFQYGASQSIFMELSDYRDHLDFDKAECSFDDPDYIRLMKYVKESRIGRDGELAENMSDLPMEATYRADKTAFFTDKMFMRYPVQFVDILHGYFDEPVTFLGFPSEQGGGYIYSNSSWDRSFSILKSAKCPEGAWEFVKYAFNYDDVDIAYRQFPVLEKDFKAVMAAMKNITCTDPETGETRSGNFMSCPVISDGEIVNWGFNFYDSLSQEEADRVESYIRSCIKNYRRPEFAVEQILEEELGEYFNSDRSAEKTAEIIQNRVSIYMSEHYG